MEISIKSQTYPSRSLVFKLN